MSDTEKDIADLREDYQLRPLRRGDLVGDPFAQFHAWFADARDAGIREVNAMTLSTLGLDQLPSSRTVLLKDLDDRGFTFYTNYQSRKAQEIEAHPQAALTFLWKALERQVQIRGRVEKVSREESEAYFYSRPYASRIGAWASRQSEQIPSREHLEQQDAEMRQRYPDDGGPDCVPIPDHWGGYRVVPISIEFWKGGPGRLHDRFRYTRGGESGADGDWTIVRLSP